MTAALKAFQRGFGTMSSMTDASEEMIRYSEQIDMAFQAGDEQGVKEKLKDLMGLDAESPYAHASKSIKIGQQAEEAMKSVDDAIFKLNQVGYSAEITNTRESSIIATNILEEAQNKMQANSAQMQALRDAGEEASEYSRYLQPKITGQIIDDVRSMIFAAAEQSEGTTVRQIIDAMEVQMSGSFKNLKSTLMTRPGLLDENGLLNMFNARQQERAVSFLERQRGLSDLTDQYEAMIEYGKQSNEQRREILSMAQDIIDNRDSMRIGVARVNEDEIKFAAALLIDGGQSIQSLELDELTEKAVRQMRMLQFARSRVSEFEMGEILSFGGRDSATGFVPPPTDLTDEERANLFRGIDGAVVDETARPTETGYKRIGKEFFDKPIVKKSAYAAAGLIAASFIYSASKDRSQSDIAGPPLLPGGSAYESMPQRQPQIPEASIFSGYNQGISYSVNIEGSREQAESFSNSIGSVARGPINSTMYKGLPQLGKDPYSQIASSY